MISPERSKSSEDTVDESVRAWLVGAYVVGLALSITLSETALILLAVRMVWRLVRGRVRPGWPLAWPIGAFIVATFVAALRSAHPGASLVSARTVFLVLSLWVVLDAVPTAAHARRALGWLLATLVITSVVGMIQVAFCPQLAAWAPVLGHVALKCHRAHGFFSIYMTLAGVLNIVLVAALPGLLARLHPAWAPVAWLVNLFAFALTYVRSAWVGFVVGVSVLAAMVPRRRVALAGGLVAVVVLLLLLPGVRGRAESIADPTDPTSSERLHMWRSGLAMARDHLLTGVGPGQVRHVYPDYAAPEVPNKHRGHLHNTPIQMLVERGIIGLGTWLWLFTAFFVRAAAVARRVAADPERASLVGGAIAATVAFLIAGLAEHNFGDTEVLLIATFVMAFVFVVEREAGTPPRG